MQTIVEGQDTFHSGMKPNNNYSITECDLARCFSPFPSLNHLVVGGEYMRVPVQDKSRQDVGGCFVVQNAHVAEDSSIYLPPTFYPAPLPNGKSLPQSPHGAPMPGLLKESFFRRGSLDRCALKDPRPLISQSMCQLHTHF